MDHPQVNHLELCAGYAGIGLGLKRVVRNLRTIAYCEIEAFACANLVSKMEAGLLDPAPIWTNLKSFNFRKFHGLVDILSGGYPCPPFSAAGKRKGKDDPRHLWPWIADGIRLCEPRLCLFENVDGHVSLGLSTVVSDLEEMGYEVSWGVFSAAEVGAPHQRKRVFILASRGCWLANAERLGLERTRNLAGEQEVPEPAHIGAGDGGVLAHSSHDGHAGGSGLRTDREGVVQAEPGPYGGKAGRGSEPGGRGHGRIANNNATYWPSRPGQQQFWWEPPRVVGQTQSEDKGDMADSGGDGQHRSGEQESGGVEGPRRGESDGRGERGAAVKVGIHGREAEPPLGGDAHGGSGWMDHAELYRSCDNRTDELRLLGNGVVPATVEQAFKVLSAEMWAKHPEEQKNPAPGV